jgi:hypothetical protein
MSGHPDVVTWTCGHADGGNLCKILLRLFPQEDFFFCGKKLKEKKVVFLYFFFSKKNQGEKERKILTVHEQNIGTPFSPDPPHNVHEKKGSRDEQKIGTPERVTPKTKITLCGGPGEKGVPIFCSWTVGEKGSCVVFVRTNTSIQERDTRNVEKKFARKWK